jgi:hypothetical protein
VLSEPSYVPIFPPPRNDPTPDRGAQLPRASALIVSSLGFIHDLRAGILEPDRIRGKPLDMDQYLRLFGSARIPTEASIQRAFSCYQFIAHQKIAFITAREAARCFLTQNRGMWSSSGGANFVGGFNPVFCCILSNRHFIQIGLMSWTRRTSLF